MLMTSVLGNQEGNQEVVYVERTSGSCDGPGESRIISPDACEAGATALGWVGYWGQLLTVNTHSGYYYPSGCSGSSGSSLWFNRINPNVDCSSSRKCLCTLLCPLNTYVDGGSCTPCDPDTYQDQIGQSSCKTCAVGKYRSEGACKTCVFGTYSDGQCPCPVGKTSNGNHCENPYLPCTIGQYDNGVCENCPVGKYQDQVGQGSCETCGFGQYQDQEGMSECKTCYGDGDCGGWEVIEVTTGTCDYSLSSSTECESALAILDGNYYSVADTSVRPTGCYEDWGFGFFNKANTGVACASAQPCICTTMATCVPGKYRDPTDNSCKSCASGQYQHQYNQDDCINGCPSGHHRSNTIETIVGVNVVNYECLICESGRYLYDTVYPCADCPNGYYQDEDGQERCTVCPVGRYQDGSECKTCARGQYQDQEGMSECKELTEASYLVLKTDTCDDVASRVSSELCQEAYDSTFGMYGPKSVNTVSTPSAPSGCYFLITDDNLALFFNTQSTDTECDYAGFTFGDQPALLQCICTACAPGTAGTGCASCAVGQYQSEYAQSSCVSCPGGQYQDQERQSSCVSCPAGFYQDGETSVNCKACIGSKEGANTCVELADLPVDMVKEAYTCGHSTLVTCGAGRRWNGAGCSTCTPIDTVESVTCTTAFDSEPVCPAGYKTGQTGQTCSGCAEGTYSLIGASTCSACTPIDNCHGSVADISCGGAACVARMINGTAVAWGHPDWGGDIRCTSDDCTPLPAGVDLTDVADISCGGNACVARMINGTAVAWGRASDGGDAPSLTNVADISCGTYACVARKYDNTAVAWGHPSRGGDIRCTSDYCNALPAGVDLTDVADISCGGYACVARKTDGTAVAWGDQDWGGDAPSLTDVADISCGGRACVARMNDGTAVAWGDQDWGGDASSVDLTDVADISCGGRACVARKTDDTAYAWGYPDWGGNAPSLTDVVDISCGDLACVARMINGTAVAWGDQDWGGDASSVDLTYVVDISCGGSACVARMINTAVAWGGADWGGNAPPLTNVADISCGEYTCAARMKDGTVVAWGADSRGGDASHISFFPGCSLSSPAQLRAMNNQCPV